MRFVRLLWIAARCRNCSKAAGIDPSSAGTHTCSIPPPPSMGEGMGIGVEVVVERTSKEVASRVARARKASFSHW